MIWVITAKRPNRLFWTQLEPMRSHEEIIQTCTGESFLAEATKASNKLSVAIDANNDDTAGINLAENKGLRLTEGSKETDSITIANLKG